MNSFNHHGSLMRKTLLFLGWKPKHKETPFWPMVRGFIRAKTECRGWQSRAWGYPFSCHVPVGHPSLPSIMGSLLPGRHSQSLSTLLQTDSAASSDSPSQTRLSSQDLVMFCSVSDPLKAFSTIWSKHPWKKAFVFPLSLLHPRPSSLSEPSAQWPWPCLNHCI